MKDGLAVRHELHIGQMPLHVPLPSEVIPGTTNTLKGHAVVQQRPDYPQGDEIAERIEASDSGAPAGALNRWAHQPHLVPVAQLVMGAVTELARLLRCECVLHAFLPKTRRRPESGVCLHSPHRLLGRPTGPEH